MINIQKITGNPIPVDRSWSRIGLNPYRPKMVGVLPIMLAMLYFNVTGEPGTVITVRLMRETTPLDDTGWGDYIIPSTGNLRMTHVWFGARKRCGFHWEMKANTPIQIGTRYRKFYA